MANYQKILKSTATYGTNKPYVKSQTASNTSPLTTKGDVYTFSTSGARLAVGTNGYVLSADSSETTGLKWVAASSANYYLTALTWGTDSKLTGSMQDTTNVTGSAMTTFTPATTFVAQASFTTGAVFGGNAAAAGYIQFIEDTSNGSHYTQIAGAASQAGNTTYTLPDAYPASSGYALTSTDAGVMSWAANSDANYYTSSAAINSNIITGTITGGGSNWTVDISGLTSVGTIATGVWSGTSIVDGKIASASNWNDAYNNYVASAAYSAGTLTFTQRDGGTFTATGFEVGDVTKVGTPVDNQLGVWTGDGTIEGNTNLTFDGTTLSTTDLTVDNMQLNGNTIASTNSNGDMIFQVNDGGINTEVMRLDGSVSRVGIGTAAPAEKLTVGGNGKFLLDYHNTGPAASTEIFHVVTSGSEASFAIEAQHTSSGVKNMALISTLNTTIKNQGQYWDSSSYSDIYEWGYAGSATPANRNFYFKTNDAHPILFYTDNTERIRVGDSGGFYMTEQAAAAADIAAYGQLWVKSDTPNKIYFTDDAGTDFDLTLGATATGTIGGTATADRIPYGDGTNSITSNANLTYDTSEFKVLVKSSIGHGGTNRTIFGHNNEVNFYSDAETTSAQVHYQYRGGAFDVSRSALHVQDYTANSSAPRVGIGTSSPATKLDVVGSITAGANSYTTISDNEYDVSSGDLLLDVAGDITLDAGGSDIKLSKAGGNKASFYLTTSDVYFGTKASDGDFYITGSDGGSAITALHFDMSEAGLATFNTTPVVGTMTSSDNSTKAASTAYVTTAVAAHSATPPGGSTTQMQYNNGGAFGGTDNLYWIDASDRLYLSGTTAELRVGNYGQSAGIDFGNSADRIFTDSYTMYIQNNNSMIFNIDSNNNHTGQKYEWRHNAEGGGGTALMTLGDDGNLGIGTTAPDSMLEISTATATDHLKLTSEGSTANPIKLIFEKGASEQGIIEYNRNGDLELYNTDNDGGVMIDGSASAGGDFYVSHAGNVGIGTTTPNDLLDVRGNIQTSGTFFLSGSDLGGKIARVDTSEVGLYAATTEQIRLGVTHSYLKGTNWSFAGSGYMRISGTKQLQFGDDEHYIYSDGTDLILKTVTTATNGIILDAKVDTTFKIDGTTKMTLDADGQLGIGTTSPGEYLEINSSADDDPAFKLYNSRSPSASGALILQHRGSTINQISTGSAVAPFRWTVQSTEMMRLDDTGLGIGTTSPDYALDVYKDTSSYVARFKNTSSNGYIMKLEASDSSLAFQTDHIIPTYSMHLGNDNVNWYMRTAGYKFGVGTSSPKTSMSLVGALSIQERADHETTNADWGQLWVKNDTPNKIYFTDDAGTDFDLTLGATATGTIGGSIATDQIAFGASANTIEGTGDLTWTHDTGILALNSRMKIVSAGAAGVSAYFQPLQDDKNIEFKEYGGTTVLAIDNSNQRVGIGTDSPTAELDVRGSSSAGMAAFVSGTGNGTYPVMHVIDSADTEVAWFEGNRAGDTGAYIAVRHWPASATENARSGIKFQSKDDGGALTNYATIKMRVDDYTGGTEDGTLRFEVMADGTSTEELKINKYGLYIDTYTRLQRNSSTNGLHLTDSGGNAVAFSTLSGSNGGFRLDNTTTNAIYRGAGVSFWDSTESYRLQGNTTSGYLQLDLNKISLVRDASSAASAMLTLGDGGTYDQFSILEDSRGSSATNGLLYLRTKKTGNYGYATMAMGAVSGSNTSYLYLSGISTNEALRFDTNTKSHAFDIAKAGYVSVGGAVDSTNQFTVVGTTHLSGNAVITGTLGVTGIATLADASVLASSAAPTADAQIANKKYVDDSISTGTIGGSVSDTYIPIATAADTLGNFMPAYVDLTTDKNVFLGIVPASLTASADYNTAFGHLALENLTDGSNNTALGMNAGNDLTQGYANVFVGYGAGGWKTTAARNTAVGYAAGPNGGGGDNVNVGVYAGYSHTGNYCVIIGADAAYNTTGVDSSVIIGRQAWGSGVGTGDSNVVIGAEAAKNATGLNSSTVIGKLALGSGVATAQAGTIIGLYAGYSLTSGYENTLVGAFAGKNGNFNETVMIGRQAGEDNTANSSHFIGFKAGAENTSGVKNTAVGYKALLTNTTGNYNVAMGHEALYTNVHGDNNVAIGYNSLYTLAPSDGGGANTAVGYNAGRMATTGTGNVFMGYSAARNITDTVDNVIIGKQAGEDNNENYNVIIGSEAALNATSIASSVVIGRQAMGAGAPTANSNVTIGYRAAYNHTTGDDNVFIGTNAGHGNTTAAQNTAVGKDALKAAQDSSTGGANAILGAGAAILTTGLRNTMAGFRAGYTTTTADYNVFLGYEAGQKITTGDGNVCLGYGAGPSSTNTESNKLYINKGEGTPLIGGDFSAGTVTINGIISATAKSFNIPHPLYKDKRLVHGSLEGPEHAIYVRGTIEAFKGCLIELPEYWSAMCEDYTVQLTPHGAYTVYIKEKQKDKVMIECSEENYKFDYYIVGARTDETLEVVQDA